MMGAELDNTDLQILNLLQQNARMTNKEIAYEVGLSQSSTMERVRKLEKRGVISKYVALLNRNKIDRSISVFVTVELRQYHEDVLRNFCDLVIPLKEVMECYQTSGDRDIILKVVVPDMQAYSRFVQEQLSSLPYIGSLRSIFVIREEKHQTAYPL